MKRHSNRVMEHGPNGVVAPGIFAVSLAKFQAAPKTKAKPAQYAARFAIEKVLQQRRYCNAFALWRTCRHKNCRRQGACSGDANACLKRALAGVPHDVQWRARQNILDATPHNVGAPERKARQCMPAELYDQPAFTAPKVTL